MPLHLTPTPHALDNTPLSAAILELLDAIDDEIVRAEIEETLQAETQYWEEN